MSVPDSVEAVLDLEKSQNVEVSNEQFEEAMASPQEAIRNGLFSDLGSGNPIEEDLFTMWQIGLLDAVYVEGHTAWRLSELGEKLIESDMLEQYTVERIADVNDENVEQSII